MAYLGHAGLLVSTAGLRFEVQALGELRHLCLILSREAVEGLGLRAVSSQPD